MVEELTDRLKAVRRSLGLTQKQLGESVGVTLRTWQDYEAGNSVPGGNALAGLVRLGVDVKWLLTGEGKKDPVKILSATYYSVDYLLNILPQLDKIIELHFADRTRKQGICHLVRFKTGELQLISSGMNCDRGQRIEEVEKIRHGMALYTGQLLYTSISKEELLALEKEPDLKIMEGLLGRAKDLLPLQEELAIYKRWMDPTQIASAQYEPVVGKCLCSSSPIEEFLSEKRKAGHDTGWVSLAFADCFPEFKDWLKKRQEQP